MTAAVAPWEKQSDESPKAYGGFQIYRDLTPSERSASRVASEYGRHVRLIERWRSRHGWVDRAAAFDAERDRRTREAMFEEATEMGRRQAGHAAEAQAALARLVGAFAARSDDENELREIPLLDLAALVVRAIPAFATAARLERDARAVLESGQAFGDMLDVAAENGTLHELLRVKGMRVVALEDEARTQAAVEEFAAEMRRLGGLDHPGSARASDSDSDEPSDELDPDLAQPAPLRA
jgi:hypothetical protein